MARRVAICLGLLMLACSKKAEEVAPKPMDVAPSSQPTAVGTGPVANDETTLRWQAPTSWVSIPNPNSMRKASYRVPKAPTDSEDAELAVSQAGGAIEDNIQRWQAQFEDAKPAVRTERTVGNLKVIVVEIKGTFLGGGMGASAGKKPKSTMLAAIVQTEMPHFFKLVGPENTVALAKSDFDKLLASLVVR